MIPLGMVVSHELSNRASKMSFSQWNDARKSFFLDLPNEPFGVRVTVWCSERRLNDPDSLLLEGLQHCAPSLAVTIADQTQPAAKTPSIAFDRLRMPCNTKASSGNGVEPAT